jgi:GT2 family glycosyltransferase
VGDEGIAEVIAVTASISEKAERQWVDRIQKYDSIERTAYKNYPVNVGLVPAYQALYEDGVKNAAILMNCDTNIIAFTHDDWEPHEPWVARIEAEFADPKVAICGMGGAKGIGTSEIYKVPYQINQLQRIGYRSNQTDHEIHGARETGACDVAVVDGFFMAVRTSFLDQIGGWKWFPHRFHMYDVALCLMAHRHGWKVRMVGINCCHHGGGTSCTPEYVMDCKERGTSVEAEHTEPHKFVYDFFRPELPLRIP